MDAVVASASDKKKKTGFGTRDGKGKGKAKEGGGESDEAGPADDDGGGEIEPASPPKATTPNRRTQRRNRAKAAAGNSPSPKKGGGDGRGEDAGGDGDNDADEGGGAPATKEGPVLNDVPSKQCPACTTRINIRVCTCVPTPPRVGGFLFNPFFLSVNFVFENNIFSPVAFYLPSPPKCHQIWLYHPHNDISSHACAESGFLVSFAGQIETAFVSYVFLFLTVTL